MWNEILKALPAVIAALSGLVGVLVGGWIARRNDQDRRKSEFTTRQLVEFFGPLLSIRWEIKARGELRVRITEASEAEWQKFCARIDGASPRETTPLIEEQRARFSKIIDYENEKLRSITIPAYRMMLTIFREKMWLADSDARAFLPALVEFVDVWERFLSDSIPGEVITAIGHTEEKLIPLYEYIEKSVDRLRAELNGETSPNQKRLDSFFSVIFNCA